MWEFYQKNPNALASVRAPLYEEKVVDFLVELAEVTDKSVTTEELYKDEDEAGASVQRDVAASSFPATGAPQATLLPARRQPIYAVALDAPGRGRATRGGRHPTIFCGPDRTGQCAIPLTPT